LLENYLINLKYKGRCEIAEIVVKGRQGLSQMCWCIGEVSGGCLGVGRGEIYFNRRAI